MKLCGELMNTEVMCCSVNARVDKLAKIMRFTDEAYIPIVEDTRTRKVVGALSDRDLLDRVLSEGRHPIYTQVKDILTDELVTCGPNAPVDMVLALMSNSGVTNIPVVDRKGCLKGVISLADIADFYQYGNKDLVDTQSA